MRHRRWFLPRTPDVVGLLRRQLALTIEGLEALAAWAGGDEAAGRALVEIEHRGDAAKWELLGELRDAFMISIEPEDVFALSRGIDWILDHARDLVSEAEAMACPPDAGIAEMATLLGDAVREIEDAVANLASDTDRATAAAAAAITAERELERVYYRRTAGLLEVGETRERISRRELYRRCGLIGETVVEVAERVIYAVVKES